MDLQRRHQPPCDYMLNAGFGVRLNHIRKSQALCRSLNDHDFHSTHVLRSRIAIYRDGLHEETRTKGGLARPHHRRKNLTVLPLCECMLQSSYTGHGERVLCNGLHR